jgi:hypothetical protein
MNRAFRTELIIVVIIIIITIIIIIINTIIIPATEVEYNELPTYLSIIISELI